MSPRRDVLSGEVPPERESVSPRSSADDERVEASLRPKSLSDFVGQRDLIGHLEIVLTAARRRNQAVDHLLFAGPPGLGKTSLAGIVATELGVGLRLRQRGSRACGWRLGAPCVSGTIFESPCPFQRGPLAGA